jgi:3-dehydroquinate synthase|tara:strand:+ start:241 stop:1332 length:1092 start_codon:yes stop_codon:yes gene_type:complete
MKSVFEVVFSDHRYPVHTGRGYAPSVAAEVEKLKAAGRPLALIVDASVERAQARWIAEAFGDMPRCVIPSGEGSKCFAELERCGDFLAENRIDRSGALFAMGGGVTGDLAGFAAASYLRGIDFYQIPTTLLAMVDSSVGGKTGINLKSGKNLVGAFHQPQAVFADMELLKSLSQREFSAGMAEVIKHGLLADAALFTRLEGLSEPLHPEHAELAEIVRRNCKIKAGVVQADTKEQAASGGRALLNLGHTFGHAIEAVAGYGEYLHGEAIAIGLKLAAQLSVELGYVEASVVTRTEALLETYDLPVRLRASLPIDALLATMARDKKVRAGKLKFVAMKELGEAVTQGDVPQSLVAKLWSSVGAA